MSSHRVPTTRESCEDLGPFVRAGPYRLRPWCVLLLFTTVTVRDVQAALSGCRLNIAGPGKGRRCEEEQAAPTVRPMQWCSRHGSHLCGTWAPRDWRCLSRDSVGFDVVWSIVAAGPPISTQWLECAYKAASTRHRRPSVHADPVSLASVRLRPSGTPPRPELWTSQGYIVAASPHRIKVAITKTFVTYVGGGYTGSLQLGHGARFT